MEQRVILKNFTAYKPSDEEMYKMYLTMALASFDDLCTPDYDEKELLQRLKDRLNEQIDYTLGMIEEHPLDLHLSQMLNFLNKLRDPLLEIV